MPSLAWFPPNNPIEFTGDLLNAEAVPGSVLSDLLDQDPDRKSFCRKLQGNVISNVSAGHKDFFSRVPSAPVAKPILRALQ